MASLACGDPVAHALVAVRVDRYNEDPFLTSPIFGESGHVFLDRLNPLFWVSNEIVPLPARFIEF
jgi:hypothetical protein